MSVYQEDIERAIGNNPIIRNLRGSTFLVTGVTGTIGSCIVDMLLWLNEYADADIRVYAAGRNTERIEAMFANGKGLIPKFYDMCQNLSLDMEADYIIHAAGHAHPAAFNEKPIETIMGTVESTYRLLNYARQHRTRRVLFLSTGEVYGNIDSNSVRACYPESKRLAETLCASYYAQYGMETVVARLCHTFGPRITETDNRASVQFMKSVIRGEDIVMTSDGAQERSYCYVVDAVAALLVILLNGAAGNAYDVAYPTETVTIAQLAEIIAGYGGRMVTFREPEAKEKRDLSPIVKQVMDGERLKELGWKPSFSIREGIEHTIETIKILQEYKK